MNKSILIKELSDPRTVVITSIFFMTYKEGSENAKEMLSLIIKYAHKGSIIIPERFLYMIPNNWNIMDKGQAYLSYGIKEKAYIVYFGL